MKSVFLNIKAALMTVILCLPLFSQAGMTLKNQTGYPANYTVMKGRLVIARIPSIAPDSQVFIPTDDTFQVTAVTIIDGNTYTSAPLDVSGPTQFLAQVIQVPSQGAYEFNVIALPSSSPNVLQFQKTTMSSVTFIISRNGRPLQNIVVNNSFDIQELAIEDDFYIQAVIAGFTTDLYTTKNPNATVTATEDRSAFDGYFVLDIQ
ncbi:hypothetical protein EZJ49_12885 [Bdellovibrio bacteriovorus]|uniref:hypothetical protein n=1 Tax=Bdellovibrio bacteriovorus TaxID=959 RepID=UPI0021CFA191|nr:hypothetical protein [Bdellovibrio bacteriovorus]UXR63961.1 hypothetical protein EZJ49_12885 [Bdellovibrio bacteriovorus]